MFSNIFDTRKFALIDVGHSQISMGAFCHGYDMFEWEYCNKLATEILRQYNNGKYVTKKDEINLTELFKLEVTNRGTAKDGYFKQPKLINSSKSDILISLHANAFNEKISGTETLYKEHSPQSKSLAYLLQNNIVIVMGLHDRGLIELHKDDRGGCFLNQLNMPAVITEAFYMDNDDDVKLAISKLSSLADAYLKSILQYFGFTLGECVSI